ncbi:MAG: uracil-DNA glycosylase [Mariprofundaceae bacterium]|nr:uracil-DNA glycosylase [Mariprofundaceae bacterium]
MPNNGDFQDYYLRHIGVSTPVPVGQSVLSADFPVENPNGSPPENSADISLHEPDAQVYATACEPSPALPADLKQLREAALSCEACALSESRTQVVFGVGCEQPDVLFIGEAPGEQEDKVGEPFVGKAGKLLDQMLAALNWSRKNVYIMNVVKCRPPGNRNPNTEEVEACSRWFDAQWQSLQPKLVCLLGKVAAQRVLGSDASLASLRGRWHEYRGVPVWVSYHPAYLLRSPTQKALAWQDFRVLAGHSRAVQGATGEGAAER